MQVLTDGEWAVLEPLILECRPKGKTPHEDLRRTMEAIIWRHRNRAKWRSIPAELGPWWMAAQTFIRWAKLGVWERLLEKAQERGRAELGMAFLDGSGLPGTLYAGISPDPANSLRALLDREFRRRVVDVNAVDERARATNASGQGHDFYVDVAAGFTREQQDALIAFLLSITNVKEP